MYVDHERVVLEIKALVASKASHGRKDLLLAIAEFEVEAMVPEGQEGFDPRPRPRLARAAGNG